MRKHWMDSGAFSAFNTGQPIDLENYCAFLRGNMRYIEHCAVLDVIGDADGTWRNQQRMEDLGTKPVPCFHYGEDPKWLVHYLDRYEYIAIGGTALSSSTTQLKLWLDDIWTRYLTDRNGRPLRKLHGFAITSAELMARYPWYSVDSSSWLQGANFGTIALADGRNMFKVQVSDKSPATGEKGKHYLTETPANQAAIKRMVEEHGFTMEQVQQGYKARRLCTAVAYRRIADHCKYRTWVNPQQSLLAPPGGIAGWKHPLARWDCMEIYFAGNIAPDQETALYTRGMHRMFSFHYVDNGCKEWPTAKQLRDQEIAQ